MSISEDCADGPMIFPTIYHRFFTEKGVPVFVFGKHNFAFPIWGHISNCCNCPCTLITFDRHADTHSPFASIRESEGDAEFSSYVERLRDLKRSFAFESAFRVCMELKNDEHIKAAYCCNWINSYHVLCSLDQFECEEYRSLDLDESYFDVHYVSRCEAPNYIKRLSSTLGARNIILDFDLDYFSEPADFSDDLFEPIKTIMDDVGAVTVALEEWHFNQMCSSDFSVEQATRLLFEKLSIRK